MIKGVSDRPWQADVRTAVVLAVIPIVGGVAALQERRWALVFSGSIVACMFMPLSGFPALIFTVGMSLILLGGMFIPFSELLYKLRYLILNMAVTA
ncbi:hypothetical protein ACFLT0_00780 [Chloroflexota bacterium]